MTEIATTPTATAQAAQPTSQAAEAKGTISSDFETFLVMLTAQLENQDPLNPLDSNDFAVQLATFSGVEQQVRTNELLESLGGQLGAMSMAELAGWVGMEALVSAPAAFDGTPVTIDAAPVSYANSAALSVYDADGTLLDTIPLPVAAGPYSWTGTLPNGNPAPVGDYTFLVESYDQAGNLLQADAPQIYTSVEEARNVDGATVLVVAGGHQINATDVTAIREPQS